MEEIEKKYVEMYKKMWLIRAFDDNARELFMKDMIRGTTHVYIGEEAIAVGVCSALRDKDYITSTHRGHGHCLAKGGDPSLMMAELLGRETGYCKGKGGSMHIADLDLGILGANGIVGGGIGLATGAAFACKYRKDGGVAVCFFGDGAINQGVFYETANMAALWKLPIIYVCERNKFAEFSYSEWYFPDQDLTKRTEPFGFKGIEVDGNDLLAVYKLATDLVGKARKGEGPFFIVANTYRIYGHTIGDPLTYRIPGEVDQWKDENHDPILRFKNYLIREEILPADAVEEIEQTARVVCEKAVKFAMESPQPSLDSLLEDIYSL
jgi:TPP-dependent pyruvate/acetoin dehydrogenase alpha subunit